MVADTKKVQSLINAAAISARDLQAIADNLEDLRMRFQTQAVDPVDTPLEGNVTAVNNWITSIRAVADDPVTAGMIAAEVPSHRGEAL